MTPPASAAFEEPLRRTLKRNLTIATVVGAVFALVRNDLNLFLPTTVLAPWPSLGGHYVELAFLNCIRARIPRGRLAHTMIRLLVWATGGALLYVGMAATALLVSVTGPPPRHWWYGGLLFIGLEVVVHGILAMRGLPSAYNGRG